MNRKGSKILAIHWSYFLTDTVKLPNAVWILKLLPWKIFQEPEFSRRSLFKSSDQASLNSTKRNKGLEGVSVKWWRCLKQDFSTQVPSSEPLQSARRIILGRQEQTFWRDPDTALPVGSPPSVSACAPWSYSTGSRGFQPPPRTLPLTSHLIDNFHICL